MFGDFRSAVAQGNIRGEFRRGLYIGFTMAGISSAIALFDAQDISLVAGLYALLGAAGHFLYTVGFVFIGIHFALKDKDHRDTSWYETGAMAAGILLPQVISVATHVACKSGTATGGGSELPHAANLLLLAATLAVGPICALLGYRSYLKASRHLDVHSAR